MRESLTIFACLLIAVLTAALVGPHFVDWSAHRAEVESRLTAAVGATVRVDGPIELQLLPTPRLVLDSVHVGGTTPGQPRLDAGRALFELSVAPLLRGEFRFTDVAFTAPRLRMTLGPTGTVALPSAGRSHPRHIEIDHMRLSRGTLEIDDPAHARVLRLTDIDLGAQGDSLLGPYQGSGHLRLPGGRAADVHFSTSAVEAGRLRLKISAALDGGPRIDLGGALLLQAAAAGATQLGFDGNVALSGETALAGDTTPWHFAAALSGDPQALTFRNIDLRAGPDEKAVAISGKGRLELGTRPTAAFTLAAPQIDLDRFFAAGKDTSVSPDRFRDLLARTLGAERPPLPPLPMKIALASPAVTLAGETLTDGALSLDLSPGALPAIRLDLTGPGASRLALDGTLETGPAAVFRGEADAGSRDLPTLRKWLAKIAPDAAADLASLPFGRFELKARTEISGASLDAQDATIHADRSVFTGALTLTRPVGQDRGRLYADLRSPSLDLDSLPDLSLPANATAGFDLSLQLDARAVRVARFGSGMIDAGHIVAELTRTNGELVLKTLTIDNIGGADIALTGALGRSGGRIDGKLDAQRLGALAALVGRVAPGPLANAFASRATALSPARITLHAQAVRETDGRLALTAFSLGGTARGTAMKADLAPASGDGRRLQAKVSLSAPQAPGLLRQLGLPSLPLSGLGPGRISMTASGPAGGPFEGTAEAQIAGTQIGFDGRTTGASAAPVGLDGQVRIVSKDVAPLLQALAISLPDAGLPDLPAHVTGHAALAPSNVSLSGLSGDFAGLHLEGDLTLAPGGTDPGGSRLTGRLDFDRLSLAGLSSLVLGPAQPAARGAFWSKMQFGLALADPPPMSIKLHADRLILPAGLTGTDADLAFALGPGVANFDDLHMKIAEGTAAGRLTLRRDQSSVFLSGAFDLSKIPFQVPSASGALSGHLDVTSTGTSAAGLAAGLAGSGHLQVTDLVLPKAAPDALASVLADSDKDETLVDQGTLTSRIGNALARGAIRLGTRSFDAGLAAGVARITPADPPHKVAPDTRASAGATIDLRNLSLDQRLTLSLAGPPKGWKDQAPPHLSVVWAGPADAPVRRLEIGSLLDGLSARAIAREQARIEAFDADVRERAFFLRRLKGLRYLHKREDEVRQFEAEQKRKAEEQAAAQAAAEAAKPAAKPAVKPPARPAAKPSPSPTFSLPVPALPPPIVIPPAPKVDAAAAPH